MGQVTLIVEHQIKPGRLDDFKERALHLIERTMAEVGALRYDYFLSEDGGKAGGIYLWHSRADAERLYTEDWKAFVRGKYGTDPQLTYLDCPVVVDNAVGEIISG